MSLTSGETSLSMRRIQALLTFKLAVSSQPPRIWLVESCGRGQAGRERYQSGEGAIVREVATAGLGSGGAQMLLAWSRMKWRRLERYPAGLEAGREPLT